MHLYFVRHGETELNRKRIHQSPNTPLSDKGRGEALSVAEFLRPLNPDMLITSEYTRARETAGIIGPSIGLTPLVQGLFYETVRPSELFGKSLFHPKTLWFVLCTFLKWKNSTWHYKDAENVTDVKRRVESAKEYLESLAPAYASVVVISHTVFINFLILRMSKSKGVHLGDLLMTLLRIRKLRNTGIVHFEYSEDETGGESTWKLLL